jgi:PAS domain-containing protein
MLSVDSQKSEDNLRQVIDTLPTLVWCTRPDGSTEFLNKRWHDYTGCSPEESRVHGWQPTVHPEDLPRVIAKGQELLTSGQPGEVEARTEAPNTYLESFKVDSWAEHERQHNRFTHADSEAEKQVLSYAIKPVEVQHYIYARERPRFSKADA